MGSRKANIDKPGDSQSPLGTNQSKQRDLRAVLMAGRSRGRNDNDDSLRKADEEEIQGMESQPTSNLIKQPNFEITPKFQSMFELYNYCGHSKNSTKFVATCKKCCEMGNIKLYSFEPNSFKNNGHRHYKLTHKEVAVEQKAESHKVSEYFAASTPSKYCKTDPIQIKFLSNLQDLVSVDGLPFSFVHGLGFQNLIYDIKPQIQMPSRQTVSRKLDRTVKTTVQPKINAGVNQIEDQFLHLSTDIWTSKRGDGIMGIKTHYIKEDANDGRWHMVTTTLSAQMFNDRHTGENIKHKLLQCLKRADIRTDKIGYLVTDGASNMVCAFKDWLEEFEDNVEVNISSDKHDHNPVEQDDHSSDDDDDTDLEDDLDSEISNDHDSDDEDFFVEFNIGDVYRLSCVAHTLQLIVKDALKVSERAKNVLDCVHKIINYFMRSSYWKTRLRALIGKVLIKPAATRWNYYYYVLNRLTQDNVYESVTNLIMEARMSPRRPKNLPPTPSMEAKEKMVEIKNLLEPITVATNALQAEGVTSSLIYYNIVSAFDEIAGTETTYFASMKAKLLTGLLARFQDKINIDTHILLSALLDPRQKTDVFKIPVRSAGILCIQTPTVEKVTAMLKLFTYPLNENQSELHRNPPATQNPINGDPFSKLANVSTNVVRSNEIDLYLNLPRESSQSDPLDFWAKNKLNFPVLSRLVKKYLAIPASTGGVERLFSLAGSLGRNRRASLTSKSLENIVLHRQYRLPMLKEKLKSQAVSRKRPKSQMKESAKKNRSVDLAVHDEFQL